MNLSGYINCDLCGKKEEERSIQDQNGHYLCFQCNGAYDCLLYTSPSPRD